MEYEILQSSSDAEQFTLARDASLKENSKNILVIYVIAHHNLTPLFKERLNRTKARSVVFPKWKP